MTSYINIPRRAESFKPTRAVHYIYTPYNFYWVNKKSGQYNYRQQGNDINTQKMIRYPNLTARILPCHLKWFQEAIFSTEYVKFVNHSRTRNLMNI